MKNLNKYALLYSFLVLIIAFSALSMSAAPSNMRFTWEGINPWNGFEGLAFTIGYITPVPVWAVYLITIAITLLIGWRLYALFNRKKQDED